MEKAVLFKLLQRKYKFRNSKNLTEIPNDFIYSEHEYIDARNYILDLINKKINFCYPGRPDYPKLFIQMSEPPLFMEYVGKPLWNEYDFISVVGSREMQPSTESWLKNNLEKFLYDSGTGVVSGGARGVDQLAHLIAIKNKIPTVVVLPSGLLNLYPDSLYDLRPNSKNSNISFVTEFEMYQKIHKSHFFYRNRLIAALGKFTLVVQANQKSGSLLTVHHCLEQGRPVLSVPAHPEMNGFDGNLKLLSEGAYMVRDFNDLHDFWVAESWAAVDLSISR